jgi:hypothetical protein
MGAALLSFVVATNAWGYFVERTPYGSVLAGSVYLVSGERHTLFEGRGNARFLDQANPPVVVASQAEELRLINVATGAELRLNNSYRVARAGTKIVVWSPPDDPNSARLFDTTRWQVLARWRTRSPVNKKPESVETGFPRG